MDFTESEIVAAVYGELFASSKEQMDSLSRSIDEKKGKGFANQEECAAWAKEHLLDLLALSKSQHQLLHMTPKGELLTLSAWKRYFSTDLLFWWRTLREDKEQVPVPWVPAGLMYGDSARIIGEKSDGIRRPLYHRDYFTPTGFYDRVNETFNVAKPFPVFAKETKRDTTHIFKYIDNIAKECNMHLLAWLRFKCMYPKEKTEVVPVIVSRTQGNGKTTFAEVICKGLFGEDNVLVTDQYDANARFNADYADALVVCAEEKEENDKRSTSSALKSRSTGKTIRKEHKGMDPIYQENYSEFIVTTNKDVPIKFESDDKQRRFMVMGSNPDFTREKSNLADEVFTKLYGEDKNGNKRGTPFVQDKELIAQFKHELHTREDIKNISLRDFPITEEYLKCRTLPRTNEAMEVDTILRSIAPFIKQSLIEHRLVQQVTTVNNGVEETLSLANFVQQGIAGIQYMPPMLNEPSYVALCKPMVFYDQNTGKPFNHATVERSIADCNVWLLAEYGLHLHKNQLPIPGGFQSINNRYKTAPAARISLAEEVGATNIDSTAQFSVVSTYETPVREGACLRVNAQWKPDPHGEFETLNEMKPGVTTLNDKSNNVQYMDTFLFEADDTDKITYNSEIGRLKSSAIKYAQTIFAERLRLQRSEADRLINEGIACRVVYSGGKSYHIKVRIKDAPTTLAEYKWLHAFLCDGIISKRLDFDPQCNDPARLTRAPIERDRVFTYQGYEIHGIQALYREAPNNMLDYNWRPVYQNWLNRPPEPYEMNGKKLRPCKQEYRDAMWALLNGTFWTDRIWNGRRQICFFPAYRLCRLLGYAHEQLWSYEGILDGLNKYYRHSEKEYWRNREHCALIEKIDQEVTAQLEEDV
jgi:hypothetical protein